MKTAVVARLFELVHYCPKLELASIYKQASDKLMSLYPDKFKEFNFNRPSISTLFAVELFTTFADINEFFSERDNQLKKKGTDPRNQEEMKQICLDNHVYIHQDKIFSSLGLFQSSFDRSVAEIFNFFNGVFPNIFIPHLYFPDHLVNTWGTFDKIVIDKGPLDLEKCLLVGSATLPQASL